MVVEDLFRRHDSPCGNVRFGLFDAVEEAGLEGKEIVDVGHDFGEGVTLAGGNLFFTLDEGSQEITAFGVVFFFPYIIAVWRGFIIGVLFYGLDASGWRDEYVPVGDTTQTGWPGRCMRRGYHSVEKAGTEYTPQWK